MSVECSAWVWKYSKTTGNDRLLLLAIADHAGDDGDHAWPSVKTLADKATCSERTVQRRIQHLEEIGCLTVVRGAGQNGTHRYRVHMDDAAKKPDKASRKRPAAVEKAVGNPGGGDKLSPPPEVGEGGDRLSPGVTQLCRSRGDTWVSPERPERPTTPQPPSRAGGRRCAHGKTSGCRPCGTSPRSALRAAAAAEAVAAAQLDMRRAAVQWCGDPDCSPEDRRRGRLTDAVAKCPDCHPDLVVGLARTAVPTLIAAGSGPPDPRSSRRRTAGRTAPPF